MVARWEHDAGGTPKDQRGPRKTDRRRVHGTMRKRSPRATEHIATRDVVRDVRTRLRSSARATSGIIAHSGRSSTTMLFSARPLRLGCRFGRAFVLEVEIEVLQFGEVERHGEVGEGDPILEVE